MTTEDHRLARRIQNHLEELKGVRKVWLAVSGGLDSIVLLNVMKHLSAFIPCPIAAIHVNHQLSEWSDSWETYVKKESSKLGIPMVTERVEVLDVATKGVEAAARTVRYEAFNKHVKTNEVLLTAHHADDQIETLIHHLCRGSGVKGLSCMKHLTNRDHYWHLRPFLDVGRAELEAYAKKKGLIWVEDESNDDRRLKRNFIRHEVVPLLELGFAGVKEPLLRVIRHMQSADTLLDEFISSDYESCKTPSLSILDMYPLKDMSSLRTREILRYWFQLNEVALPSERKLESILANVLFAGQAKNPEERFGDVTIRRYRGQLYLFKGALPDTRELEMVWNPGESLELPHGLGTLSLSGSNLHKLQIPLVVRFRKEGEKISLDETVGPQSVKKLFQNGGVAPWLRSLVPLIFAPNGELIAIADMHQSIESPTYLGDDSVLKWHDSEHFISE